MDSMDVYLEKREQRRRRLKMSMKRAAAFAAKLGQQQQQQQSDTGKACKSLTKPVTFALSVLSTTQINTNFTAMYIV